MKKIIILLFVLLIGCPTAGEIGSNTSGSGPAPTIVPVPTGSGGSLSSFGGQLNAGGQGGESCTEHMVEECTDECFIEYFECKKDCFNTYGWCDEYFECKDACKDVKHECKDYCEC